jgi:CubicO group peptidase (beta-lactamase class C family)
VKAQPSTSFRSTYEYSNVPFTTAGLIAGKIEGSDYAGVVQKRIFDPLGMTSSSCSWRTGSSRPDHATPHYYAFDKSITAVQWNEYESGGGAGVIDSSARDLGRWLQFQLAEGKHDGKQFLSARALRETHTPQMLTQPDRDLAKFVRFTSYGLGWQVHDYRGVTCVTHSGSHTGFRARCLLVPEKELGMFVLCNMGPSSVCDIVTKTALDSLLGLPAEDWLAFYKSAHERSEARVAAPRTKRAAARKPDTKPSLPLEAYVGGYEEPAYGRIEVTLEDGQLVGRWGKYTVRLEHYHFDTFTAVLAEPPDAVVSNDRQTYEWHFRVGTSGEVESLKGFGQQDFKRATKK